MVAFFSCSVTGRSVSASASDSGAWSAVVAAMLRVVRFCGLAWAAAWGDSRRWAVVERVIRVRRCTNE